MPTAETQEHMRVSSTTGPQALAAAIAHACYQQQPPTLRAVGPAAVNQAIKAATIAAQYVAARSMTLSLRPGLTTITMPDGDDVTAVLLRVVVD